MSSNDIWYGVLEAGSKTSPVVRDPSIQTDSSNVWLYNHARDTFVQYSLAIVEPKLRKLAKDDISQDELEQAFKNARKSFTALHKVNKWDDEKAPAPKAARQDDDDIDIGDEDDMEEFIDDVAEGE